MNSARLSGDKSHYRTLKDDEVVYIHPTSVLFRSKALPNYIVYSEVVVTTKKYVREVSEADYGLVQGLLNRVK